MEESLRNKFTHNIGCDDVEFDVSNEKEFKITGVKVPESLWRMMGVNYHSVDSLLNNYLYFSHANQLNDISEFDFNIFNKFKREDNISKRFKSLGIKKEKEYNSDNNTDRWVKRQLLNSKESFRTLSFTNNLDNNNYKGEMLMWSHYGECHTGIAIKYNSDKLRNVKCNNEELRGVNPFYGIYPIQYIDDKFSPIDASNLDPNLVACTMSAIKTDEWKYEDEWRILVSSEMNSDVKVKIIKDSEYYQDNFHDHNKYKCELDTIEEVRFGNRFFVPDFLDFKNSLRNGCDNLMNFDENHQIIIDARLINDNSKKILKYLSKNPEIKTSYVRSFNFFSEEKISNLYFNLGYDFKRKIFSLEFESINSKEEMKDLLFVITRWSE